MLTSVKKLHLNSDIYKVLDKNTTVTILGYEDGWTKVNIDDTVGYVYSKYVTNVIKL